MSYGQGDVLGLHVARSCAFGQQSSSSLQLLWQSAHEVSLQFAPPQAIGPQHVVAKEGVMSGHVVPPSTPPS